MNKKTPVRVYIPPQVIRDFAGVRGRVVAAVKASPQSVTFSDVLKQSEAFSKARRGSIHAGKGPARPMGSEQR